MREYFTSWFDSIFTEFLITLVIALLAAFTCISFYSRSYIANDGSFVMVLAKQFFFFLI